MSRAMAKGFKKTKDLVIDMSFEAGNVVVDLLRILKSKYDYRALSTITGFPVSTLTRYITGKTAPKGTKAERLLKNLLSNINLTALIMNDFGGPDGNPDLSKLLLNPNIIKVLSAHIINEFIGMKITSILPLDILGIPLATYLAAATSRPLYLISPEPVTVNGDVIPIIFSEDGHGQAQACWLMMNKCGKKESVLIICSQTPNPYFFNSLIETIWKMGIELGGFFTIVAKEENLRKMKIPPGVKRSYIILG